MPTLTLRNPLAGLWPRRAARPAPGAAAKTASAGAEPAAAAPLLQLWARHVAAAGQHGTDSVDALTQTFAVIERQLAGAMETARNAAGALGSEGGAAGRIEDARGRLQAVLAHIESAVSSNHALLQQLSEAAEASRSLRDTAQSVERIAQMTSLLSINARIEAARAGPAGAGFAVVADEVRKLAAQAREDSQTILGRVDRIGKVMGDVAGVGQAMRERGAELMAHCRAEVGEVIDGFDTSTRRLVETSEGMAQCAQGVQHAVAEALERFQFQDRVAQRLAHVRASIDATAGTLAGGWPSAATLADLEQRLFASYTMPDEERTHRGETGPAPQAAAADTAAEGGLILF